MCDRRITTRGSVVYCCAIKRSSKQFRLLIEVLVLGRRIRFSGVVFTLVAEPTKLSAEHVRSTDHSLGTQLYQ